MGTHKIERARSGESLLLPALCFQYARLYNWRSFQRAYFAMTVLLLATSSCKTLTEQFPVGKQEKVNN